MWRVVVVVLVIGLVAGCGGGSKRLSKEEYAKRADAICARGKEQTRSLPTTNINEIASASDKVAAVLHEALGDLRKLKPPEDEQQLADAWLRQIEKLEGDVKDLRDKAKANDLIGARNVALKAQADDERGKQLATQLGMSECNKD